VGCVDHIGGFSVYSFRQKHMVKLNSGKMSDEDRLNYLYNELEELNIKKRRFQKDPVRDPEDIAFYLKCNQHHIDAVEQDIHQLQQKLNKH
jgi:hypothetical protein